MRNTTTRAKWVVAGLGTVLVIGGCESRREQRAENRAERVEQRADYAAEGTPRHERLEDRAERMEDRADQIPNVAPGSPQAAPLVASPTPQAAPEPPQVAPTPQPAPQSEATPQARGGGPATPQDSALARQVESQLETVSQQVRRLRERNEQLDGVLSTAEADLGPIYRRNADAFARAMEGDFTQLRARLPQIRESLRNTELWQRYGDDFNRVAQAIEQSGVDVQDVRRALRARNIDVSDARLNNQEMQRLIEMAQQGLARLQERLRAEGEGQAAQSPSAAQ